MESSPEAAAQAEAPTLRVVGEAEAATRDAILTIVRGNLAPAVLDADALNAFAASARARRELRARGRAMVLTPHPGEMARLLGSTTAAVQADRSGAARRLADGTQAWSS